MSGLKTRQRWLRWKVYGGDIAFVGAFAGGVYVAFGLLDWSAWNLVGLFAGIAVLSLLYRGRGGRVRAAQLARGRWLLEQAYGEASPPILILRSFQSFLTMPPRETVQLFGDEKPINDDDSPAAPRSHVLRIASEALKFGPVVAIGAAQRGMASAARVDVLFFQPGDAEWFEVFELLSVGSRAILLLPGETAGVGKELTSLRDRGLREKLILVMPPLRRPPVRLPWVVDHTADIERGWDEARKGLLELDVALPEYEPGGLAFTLNERGEVQNKFPLQGSFVRLSRAVKQFTADFPPQKGRPLGEIMLDLERFELRRPID